MREVALLNPSFFRVFALSGFRDYSLVPTTIIVRPHFAVLLSMTSCRIVVNKDGYQMPWQRRSRLTAVDRQVKMIVAAASRNGGATAWQGWHGIVDKAAFERDIGMDENTLKRSPATMIVLLALHAVCGVIILWLLLRLVPQYMKFFKDFGMRLPDMTLMVIRLSIFFGHFWFVVAPGLAAADFAIVVLLHRARRTGLLTAWGVLVWLIEMLLIAIVVLAISVPLTSPQFGLSGGK
jgi:hypothetical protein